MNQHTTFKIMDRDGVLLPKAEVRVNGILCEYDNNAGLHMMVGEDSDKFDLEVKVSGFRTIDIKKIPWAQRPHKIYLGREGDPWYIDVNGIPVAYSYRPRDILVVLQDSHSGQAIQIDDVKTEILSLPGLEGYKVIDVDWKAGLNPKSLSRRVGNRNSLRAPADLPASHVEVASLHKNDMVQFAGPLFMHGEEYGRSRTVRLTSFQTRKKMKNYGEGTKLATQGDGHSDVQAGSMVIDSDAENVV